MTAELRKLDDFVLQLRRKDYGERLVRLRMELEETREALLELDAEYVHRVTGLSVGCQVYTDDALLDAAINAMLDSDYWDVDYDRVHNMRSSSSAPEDRTPSTVVRLHISNEEMLADVEIAATGHRVYYVRAETLTKVEETPK